MAPNGRYKKQRKKCHVLTKAEIKYLAENTNFGSETIIDWHKVFSLSLQCEMILCFPGLHGGLSRRSDGQGKNANHVQISHP